jgi:hypothetical protein
VADKKLKVDLVVDTKKAQTDLKAAAKESEKLGLSFEETESAGQQMARKLEAVAGAIETEMADARSAAEKLGQALGPEFAADAAKGEAAVQELVLKLKAAGLTYDDIRADADRLADAIKRLDDAGRNLDGVSSAAKTVEGDFKRVAGEADNTRSVVANFAGNAAQEIPGITGAMGPLNMAIGQFGEYAAEGNIKLSNFVAAGAGLGIVSAAIVGITGQMKEVAKVKAFDKAQIEAFRDALLEADDAATAVEQTLRTAGEVAVSIDLGGAFSDWKIDDITPALAEAGLTLEQFSLLVEGGEPKIQAWATAARAAGVDVEAVGLSVLAARDQHLKLEAAQIAAAASSAFFGDESAKAEAAAKAQADATKELAEDLEAFDGLVGLVAGAQTQLEETISAANDAMLEQAAILQEQIDAQRAAADSAFAFRDAEDDLVEKINGANDAMKEADGDLRKVRAVLDDVAQSSGSVADAALRVWEEQAKANGTTLTATQKQDLWNRSMIESASTLDGPMRDAVLDYAANVNGIPPEKLSEIKALLDEGKVAEAEAALNDASRTRDAAIEAQALTDQAEQDLEYLARTRNATINAQIVARGGAGYGGEGAVRARASGGPVSAGRPYLVGEEGPELMVPGSNGTVIPSDKLRTATSGGGTTSNTYSITVNVAPGGDPASTGRALVEAIQDYERVNSSRWRAS